MPAESILARLGAFTPIRAIAALGALVALSACEPVSFGGAAPRIDPGSGPVQVALLVPGGSSDQGRQVLATSLENAARLAVSDLQGVDIDLRIYETAGDPGRAAQVAQQAADAGASVILGPVFGDEANTVGRVAASHGLSVLSFSNNTAIAGGNVFILGQSFDTTAERLLGHAAREGRGQVMIVAEHTTEGEIAEAAIRAAAGRTGASIVATETYAFSQQGIVEALPGIAASARASGAQTLFFTANTAGALPILAQLLPDNRISHPQFQFMGLSRWDIPPPRFSCAGCRRDGSPCPTRP